MANGRNTKNTLLKVVILGDVRVGKSCLMNRFVKNHFDDHIHPTIGVELLDKEIRFNNDLYTFQIWDTAGQERFKSLRTPFYRGSDICILTFALDDRSTFNSLSLWKNEFLHYANLQNSKIFPFVVIGTKVDVGKWKREVSEEEVRKWCQGNGNPPYVETSAKDAINVEEAFIMALETWTKFEAELDKHNDRYNMIKIQRDCTRRSQLCCNTS